MHQVTLAPSADGSPVQRCRGALVNRIVPWVLAFLVAPTAAHAAEPLRLHPDNPRYFLFRGKPTVLITSGEHYGAVLNLDFDYLPYLDELQKSGLNLTRTFSGTYREVPGSFGITENTLAPASRRYCCPWARSATPGAADGSAKFDLEKWDTSYFDRLRDFISQAGKRGIVVELVLFCALYNDKLWEVNPMKASNNVNGVGAVPRGQVYTLKNDGLLAAQDALARKICAELKDCDNLYYEICNEPYFGGVTSEWNDHLIATLVDAEASFPSRHLIAQNISNGSAKVEHPNKHVSIFNFHYSTPPNSVGMNDHLKKAIADDETGFKGKDNLAYRTEGWDFIVAGGAVYSNLDYSFTCRQPQGSAPITTSPGGGGSALRSQLKVLKRFIDGFDFIKMAPANAVIQGGVPSGATARVLAERGKAYAIYVKGGQKAELILDLPAGSYHAEWLNTKTGSPERRDSFQHPGGKTTLVSPSYAEDVALRITTVVK
jgi:hypothetical protein